MSKDDIITLALYFQDKFNSTLANINIDIGELNYKFEKVESELMVSRSVNSNLFKKRTILERQCRGNNQYSRRKCLEISGIPENNENKDLENLTLQIFEKIDISVDPRKRRRLSLGQNTAFKKSDNQVIQTERC